MVHQTDSSTCNNKANAFCSLKSIVMVFLPLYFDSALYINSLLFLKHEFCVLCVTIEVFRFVSLSLFIYQ